MPAFDGMALFAIGTHLALVDVSVAVGALFAHIRKHRLDVALRACHALVHAAQRILGGVVIELRNCTNRLPRAQGVTVLAGNAETTVRAPGVGGRLPLTRSRLTAGQQGECDNNMK